VIVPSGQQDTTAETARVAPAAATEYSAVDREDQVNIQISFDFDSAALREDQKPKLATLCDVMKSVDVAVYQIVGHTDSSGTAAYNERLSLLRAQEVKRYLVNDCGLQENQLEAIGMGESAPYDTANPRAEINRRVEFQALG
jgi:OmpA-OmpF porin, OOP family